MDEIDRHQFFTDGPIPDSLSPQIFDQMPEPPKTTSKENLVLSKKEPVVDRIEHNMRVSGVQRYFCSLMGSEPEKPKSARLPPISTKQPDDNSGKPSSEDKDVDSVLEQEDINANLEEEPKITPLRTDTITGTFTLVYCRP